MKTLALLLSAVLLAAPSTAQDPVPEFVDLVTDHAEILEDADEARLLDDLATARSSDDLPLIAVLTVRRVDGSEDIELYAERVALAWNVDESWRDRGVLLVVDMTSRSLRIQVADALRDRLTDAEAQAVMDHDLQPQFRQGRFADGLSQSLDALRREAADGNAAAPAGAQWATRTGPTLLQIGAPILLALLLLLVFWSLNRPEKRTTRRQRRRRRRLGRHFSGWGSGHTKHRWAHGHHMHHGGFGGGGFSGGGGFGGGGGFSGGASGSF